MVFLMGWNFSHLVSGPRYMQYFNQIACDILEWVPGNNVFLKYFLLLFFFKERLNISCISTEVTGKIILKISVTKLYTPMLKVFCLSQNTKMYSLYVENCRVQEYHGKPSIPLSWPSLCTPVTLLLLLHSFVMYFLVASQTLGTDRPIYL